MVSALTGKLKAQQSSIFRLFKKRKIRLLSQSISSKNRDIEIMKTRLTKCNAVISRMNSARARRPLVPPKQPAPA
jgi:hypothetical protein